MASTIALGLVDGHRAAAVLLGSSHPSPPNEKWSEALLGRPDALCAPGGLSPWLCGLLHEFRLWQLRLPARVVSKPLQQALLVRFSS